MSELTFTMEFIDLCIDNYNNGGHSSTKEKESRYFQLKHKITLNEKIVEKIRQEINKEPRAYIYAGFLQKILSSYPYAQEVREN